MKNLVISNNKVIWSKEYKNILLGEWCLEGVKNQHNFQKFNYEILKSFWSEEKNTLANVKLIQNELWDKIINFISVELNNYHKTNFDKKYWEIIVAGWLIVYLPMLFERFGALKSVKEKFISNEITSKFFLFNYEKFIPNNTFHFRSVISLSNNWNHWINSEIIQYLHINFEKVEKLDENNNLNSSSTNDQDNLIIKNTRNMENKLTRDNNNLFSKIKSKIKKLCFQNYKIIIIDCYISKLEKLFLYVISLSLPAKFFTPYYEITKTIDTKFRNKNVEQDHEKDFLNFFKSIFFKSVPKSFIEDYVKIKSTHQNSYWPKKPKVILTSIANIYNDVFNNYCSEKKLLNTKLCVYQHGGTYKVNKYNFGEFMEQRLADIYLTYGWTSGKKTYPFFFSTNKTEKNFKKNQNAKGIIISATNFYNIPYQLRPIPSNYSQTKKHINNINSLLNSLSKEIVNSKLHVNYANFNRNPNLKNLVTIRGIKFNNIEKSTISKSIDFRLILETVNSTGFLENLFFNVPFVALFDKEYCPINDESQIDYEPLIKNNIVFYDPKKAAEHINKIYYDTPSWWEDNELQRSRKIFCDKYVRKSDNKYISWYKFIKKI